MTLPPASFCNRCIALLLLLSFIRVDAQDQYRLGEQIDSLRFLTTNARVLKVMDIMTPLRDKLPSEDGQQQIKHLKKIAEELNDKRMYAYVLCAEAIWQIGIDAESNLEEFIVTV